MPEGTMKGLLSHITKYGFYPKENKKSLEDLKQRAIILVQKEHTVAAFQMCSDSVEYQPRD